ncbi:MAG: DUF817 domain-containing protein [Patescibacteria group bacterium]
MLDLKTRFKEDFHEFLVFGWKQARACVFVGSFLAALILSNYIPLFGLARYDFLFLAAILIQVVLVLTKLETKDEVKVIMLFHVIGFALEVFKTSPGIGSWSYPEPGVFKLFNVPLYSGFMYSAVGSYISQAWKLQKLRVENYPPYIYSVPLAAAIYLNFFTHHYLPDFRWVLTALVVLVFWKTDVYFVIIEKVRRMKLLASFALIGFFIWIAENISTWFGAWQYPDQTEVWHLVSFGKISSWALLVIISVIIIADLKQFKAERDRAKIAI